MKLKWYRGHAATIKERKSLAIDRQNEVTDANKEGDWLELKKENIIIEE